MEKNHSMILNVFQVFLKAIQDLKIYNDKNNKRDDPESKTLHYQDQDNPIQEFLDIVAVLLTYLNTKNHKIL